MFAAHSPCLSAALDYARRGWSVVALCPPNHGGPLPPEHLERCDAPGQTPPWPWQTCRQRRLSVEAVLSFYWRNPQCNVGVVPGIVSGIIGVETVDRSDGILPQTATFSLVGQPGLCRLYAVEGAAPLASTVLVGPGGERLRVNAGDRPLVLPPSRHVTGTVFEWARGGPDAIAPAPAWLLQRSGQRPGEAETPAAGVLVRRAGALRRQGANEEELYEALRVLNGHCVPALSEPQLRRIAKAVARGTLCWLWEVASQEEGRAV